MQRSQKIEVTTCHASSGLNFKIPFRQVHSVIERPLLAASFTNSLLLKMEDNNEHPDDAITQEEINSSVLPGHAAPKPLANPPKRNACTEEH